MTTELVRVESTGAVTKAANLEELGERFLAAQDVSKESRENYRRALRPFFAWLLSAGVADLSRTDVLAYKESLVARKLKPGTVTTYLSVVRLLFTWLEAEKLFPNVARGVKGAKRPRGFRKDCLTVSQVKELLVAVDRSTVDGKRDFALLNLLVRTGLRTVEVIRADVGDIRQEGGEALLYVQGKGRDEKDEFVLLTDATLRPLTDYLAARGPVAGGDAAPLFASMSDRNAGERLTTRTLRGIVKKNLRGIGLDNHRLTTHSLRHTTITLANKAGGIGAAQAIGRHADPKTTMVYARNLDRVTNAPERLVDELLGA